MNPGIRGVLLDVDGTLLDGDAAIAGAAICFGVVLLARSPLLAAINEHDVAAERAALRGEKSNLLPGTAITP